MKRLIVLSLVVLCAGGFTAYAIAGQPGWYHDLEKQTDVIARQQLAAVPYPTAQMKDSLERRNLRERLLRFNDEPVVFDQIYLVADLFQGLTMERLSNETRSLYSLFENDFGVRMILAEERLRAVSADPRCAELLAVAPGAPLLLVERTAYSYGNKPVEWRRGFYSTKRHHYRNDLG